MDYDAGLTLEWIRHDPLTYLVPEYSDNSKMMEVLEWAYDMIRGFAPHSAERLAFP